MLMVIQSIVFIDNLQQNNAFLVYLYDMADLTRDNILKLAQLVRISLTDDEASEFTGEISKILKYVELLDSIDTEGLLPTSQVTGLTNVTRADVVREYGYSAEALLKNVPAIEAGQIKVKRMIG